MTDELAERRKAKREGERVLVNSYGNDGYVLIDCPLDQIPELQRELARVLDDPQ